MSVGFTRPIPSQEEINDEQEEKRYSSMDAGWTIICNDRAVLYCDRTVLTGWGKNVYRDTIHSLSLFLVLLNFKAMMPQNSLQRLQKGE